MTPSFGEIYSHLAMALEPDGKVWRDGIDPIRARGHMGRAFILRDMAPVLM